MFCENCGKEVSDGAAFCDYCGNPLEKEEVKREKKKGSKFPAVLLGVIVLLLMAGAGGFWYINSGTYQCKKALEQAKASVEAGDYEEALACCEEALALDHTCMDAYIQAADVCLLMENYEKAVEILLEGIECTEPSEKDSGIFPKKLAETYQAQADQYAAVYSYGDAIATLQDGIRHMKDLEGYEDILSGKLEEVCQAQADYLVGTWVYRYDLTNVLPKEAQDLAEVEMEVYFEFHEDGMLKVYVDKDFWSENVSGTVGGAVDFILGFFPVPGHVKSMAETVTGAVSGWAAGFFAGNASVDYHYETDESVIYCTEIVTKEGQEAGEASYSFVIDQGTLQFLEKTSASETTVYFVECPMKIEKSEEE